MFHEPRQEWSGDEGSWWVTIRSIPAMMDGVTFVDLNKL